jgi:hypothetical protein
MRTIIPEKRKRRSYTMPVEEIHIEQEIVEEKAIETKEEIENKVTEYVEFLNTLTKLDLYKLCKEKKIPYKLYWTKDRLIGELRDAI